MIPKYQYIFTSPDTSWGKDWKSRLTTSKVLRLWKGSKRPKAETSQEYTRRRIKEATKQDKVLNTTANVLHKIGVGATTAGLLGSLVLAPAATVGTVVGGTAGSKLTDKVVLRFTGDKLSSWAREFNRKLGLRDNSIIGELTNPGMLIGGGFGARMAPTVASWYKPIRTVDLSNNIDLSHITLKSPLMTSDNIIYLQPRSRFKPILEEDIPELQRMFDSGEFKEVPFTDKLGRKQVAKMYYLSGNKQPLNETTVKDLIKKYGKSLERQLSTEEKEIAKQHPLVISRLKKLGLNFDDDSWFGNRLYSKMSDKVTQNDTDIFHSHLPEYETIANDFIKTKKLVPPSKEGEQWKGYFTDGYKEVDPESYVVAHSKAFLKNYTWDGVNRHSAMSFDNYEKLLENEGIGAANWGTDNTLQVGIFQRQRNGVVAQNMVGNKNAKQRTIPSKYAHEAQNEAYEGITKFDKKIKYGKDTDGKTLLEGDWIIFGPKTGVKALRGNNGDFIPGKGYYRALVPTIPLLGTYFISNSKNIL